MEDNNKMIDLREIDCIMLFPGYTDMRLGITGLMRLISIKYKNIPLSTLYVFCGKGKNSIKVIQKDESGYWLYQKKLAKGKFAWPSSGNETQVTKEQILWIINGLSLIKIIENNGESLTKNICKY